MRPQHLKLLARQPYFTIALPSILPLGLWGQMKPFMASSSSLHMNAIAIMQSLEACAEALIALQ